MNRLSLPLLAIAAAQLACPQAITTGLNDGSSSSSDGGPVGSDGHDMREDTGTATNDGGPNTLDGSVGPGGGLSWGQMTLPTNSLAIRAVWGRSASEVYAGEGHGWLLSFQPGSGWSTVWENPDNQAIHALWGTATTLFVASETKLFVFANGVQASPVSYPVGKWIYDIDGRSDTEVYLVSDQQNGRGLYRFNGMDVQPLEEPDFPGTLASVLVQPNEIFIGGSSSSIHRYANSTFYPAETVAWLEDWTTNEKNTFIFQGLGVIGTQLFAVGDARTIFRRGSGQWEQLHRQRGSDKLNALVETGSDAYFFGDNTTGGPILRYIDGSFYAEQTSVRVDILDAWAASENEVFAVGFESSSIGGVILRGTR